jgi:hypothetical protein
MAFSWDWRFSFYYRLQRGYSFFAAAAHKRAKESVEVYIADSMNYAELILYCYRRFLPSFSDPFHNVQVYHLLASPRAMLSVKAVSLGVLT